MYCKNETSADIESKRRIISEKIEMKRNSSNAKRTSMMVNAKGDGVHRNLNNDAVAGDENDNECRFDAIFEEDERKPSRPTNFNPIKLKSDSAEQK